MLKNQLGSKSNINMAYMPEIADLHHFMSSVLENPGKQINITWLTRDKLGTYTLNITSLPLKSDPEWHLTIKKGIVKRTLWQHNSCDVLLINNLLVSTCSPNREQVDATGKLATNPITRPLVNTEDQYFVKADKKDKYIETREDPNITASMPVQTNHAFGDLSVVAPMFVLRSLGSTKATGKLKLKREDVEAEIFLVDGEVVHAQLGLIDGLDAIYTLMEWETGIYSFEPLSIANKRTINTELDVILMTGIKNKEDSIFLRNNNIGANTVLVRRNVNLTDKEFDSLASTGSNLDLNFQRSFYKYIDDKSTLHEIITRTHLTRDVWMSVVANFVKSGMVSATNSESWGKGKKPPLRPKSVDVRAIDSVMMTLRHHDTGLFTYPAFLYFLEQEFFRSYRQGAFFSILNIQIWQSPDDNDYNWQWLDKESLTEAIRRISKLKRYVDVFSHYENNDYVILLPNTALAGATTFAHRITRELTKEPLSGHLDPNNLKIAIGISGIPEDVRELGLLLSAAEFAKNHAQLTRNMVFAYQEFSK